MIIIIDIDKTFVFVIGIRREIAQTIGIVLNNAVPYAIRLTAEIVTH